MNVTGNPPFAMEGMMIGSQVSFWEYDRKGEMTRFEGAVQDRFVDPDEKYARPSLLVRMPDGSVQTPYEDECKEIVTVVEVVAVEIDIEMMYEMYTYGRGCEL